MAAHPRSSNEEKSLIYSQQDLNWIGDSQYSNWYLLSLLNKNLHETYHHHHKGNRAFIYQMLAPSAPKGNTQPPFLPCWRPIALQGSHGFHGWCYTDVAIFRFCAFSARGISLQLFLPSVFQSLLCQAHWEWSQLAPAGTYLPDQTPTSALDFAHAFALQALRNLSGGTQAEEEVGRNCFLSRPISLAKPVFHLHNQCINKLPGLGPIGR